METEMTGNPQDSVAHELAAMLAEHDDAWVGAITEAARYVPVPAGVPLRNHRLLGGRWALDLVVAADRMKLADIYRDRFQLGWGTADVELVSGGRAAFTVFALTERLGADVIVVVPSQGADMAAAMDAPPELTSTRFSRTLRDERGRTIEIDDAAPRVLGVSAEELLSQRPPLDQIHPDDRAAMLETWFATLANVTDGHRCRARVMRGDGSYIWIEFTNFNRLDDPVRPHVVTEMLDISEEMAAHEAVAAREQLLHRLAAALPLGVLQLDPERRVVYKNDNLAEILDVAHASTMDEQFVRVVPEDREQLEKAFSVALDDGSDDDVIVRIGDRIVRVITKSLNAGSGEVTGVIACVSDVTQATLMGRELERRATFDALTGCHNRAAILTRLESALGAGTTGVAAVFLDLDGFKQVNDRDGHAAGDALLSRTARVIASATRPTDVVGRLGGDEFLVVCDDVTGPDTAVVLANRIADALRVAGVASSVGVAWAAVGSVDADGLVLRADEAMYASKRSGGGRLSLAG
jgi:diguanylate cyclase (GGDEF)-like protein/PAS domain S-box-containing protein